MFETAELGRELDKAEFQERAERVRTELLKAQQELAGAGFSVVMLIGGVDGAGKGDVLNRLFEWMDARGLTSHTTDDPTQDERERPNYWRYWMALPPKGRICIFHGGWYAPMIERRVFNKLSDDGFGSAIARVNAFERNLCDDGTLVIKLWLHISKKQQRKRLKKLEKDPKTRWRVTGADWRHHEAYDQFRKASERALRETSTGDAPWNVIESADWRFRDIVVAETVLARIRERLANNAPSAKGVPSAADLPDPTTILDQLVLTTQLDKKDYDSELEHWQGELNHLSRRIVRAKRGVILVFEGWDAGGKGGAIRRITRALDARQYRVIPISAPTDEERSHHYLWRFWRYLPRLGKFTIYDRSWYGRVLVERVEGFANERAWMRAYKEINDFEEQLTESGIVVVKFWLHISREEQLRRFEAREREPWKQYKIGPDDYRNRAKTNAYEGAANDMIGRTSTEFAPWVLVEAEDKRFGRVKAIRETVERIADAL